MRKGTAIELGDAQRKKLVKLAHSNTTEVRLARRRRMGWTITELGSFSALAGFKRDAGVSATRRVD